MRTRTISERIVCLVAATPVLQGQQSLVDEDQPRYLIAARIPTPEE